MKRLRIVVVDGILEAERTFSSFYTVVRRVETHLEVITIDGAFVREAKLKYTWRKYDVKGIIWNCVLQSIIY